MPDEPTNPITDPLWGKQVLGTPVTKTWWGGGRVRHLSEEQTNTLPPQPWEPGTPLPLLDFRPALTPQREMYP